MNEFTLLFPDECENCFCPLAQTPDAVQRYQTVEWLRHRVGCPRCSHKTWASLTFSPTPRALVVTIPAPFALTPARSSAGAAGSRASLGYAVGTATPQPVWPVPGPVLVPIP